MTLEQFRLASIKELKDNSNYIKTIIHKKLKLPFLVYIHGSVLDKTFDFGVLDVIVFNNEKPLRKNIKL